MLSRFVGTALVMFAIGGFVLAGEYTGVITKHDSKDGITFKTKKDKKTEEKTIKVGKSVKITKGEDTVDSKEFAELVTKAADTKAKGVRAKITTEGEDEKEVVTKIEILKKKK